ncbi:protein Exd1 homolog [Malaya genurostris]|uniref:protein Exd1 homolog n=1 Tax=Malaya genurostris TaxID=325434 RepID=UPI0026F390B2|nr:protein Exd1 homolog [Malaya genurostris]
MDKLDLFKGQIVLLELEEECVIGEILHIGAKKSFVRLQNVRDFQSNLPICGNQDYYSSEIRNIKIIEQSNPSETNSTSEIVSSIAALSITRIDLEDVQQIFDQITAHVFIHQTDIKYHDAIKYLKTQKLIALAMEGIAGGRHATAPSLLSIATTERIYVFDVMWMNITNDLKAILASSKVRRVVHNGRLLEDVLKHRYGAPLGKCFDTLVAHIATTENYDDRNELTIQQCLSKYLNLPSNFFNGTVTFANRPLNDIQRKAAAKNVAFLLTLQDYLVHEVMLESFYRSCNRYGTSLAGGDEHFTSIMKLSKGRNEDLIEIDRFKLNIIKRPITNTNVLPRSRAE